jgi:hypothetical protein
MNLQQCKVDSTGTANDLEATAHTTLVLDLVKFTEIYFAIVN